MGSSISPAMCTVQNITTMCVPWRKVIRLTWLTADGNLKEKAKTHIRGEKEENVLNPLNTKVHFLLLLQSGVYRILLGKLEGKKPLGIPRRRWVDNIRMDLQEVGCGYVDWIGLTKGRDRWRTLVSAVMNFQVP